MADRVVVAELGVEGGGVTILGTRVSGAWRFWQEGSSLGLDEDDVDYWRSWASEQAKELADVVPSEWPLMFPIVVHPDFVEWFRGHYQAARAGLQDGLRDYQAEHQNRRWQKVFWGASDV